MHGAHVCAAPRRLRRSARSARGLGWWQPPTRPVPAGRRQRRRVPDERPPRHRMPEAAETTAPPNRRLRRTLVLGTAVLVLGPLSAFAPGFLLIAVPGPDDVVRGTAALISYADGSELARLAPAAADRLRLDRVPEPVRDAVLAVQDPDFGTRPLADPAGLVHAASGGSTATGSVPNQFVDRAMAGFAPTPWRAYREVVLVSKLAMQGDRDQVLTDYLDAAYLGRGDYGLTQGARDYFGKDIADLTLEEGALLAALIGDPAADPAADPARAEQLWNQVLDAMVARGWLAPDRRAAARFPVTLPRRPDAGLPADARAQTVAAVLDELRGLGFDESQVAVGGLRVTTTLDPARQSRATAAADGVRGAGAAVGIVAVDPATGGVLAYHGGPDGREPDAARAVQPAGAAMTPFVLLAGRLQDPPVDPQECADCAADLAGLTQRIGPAAVAATAVAAGLADPAADPAATDVDAVDLASAYATLAAGGVRRPVHLVETVSTPDGRVLYTAPGGGEQRLPAAAARAATPDGPGGGPWAAGVADGVAAAVRVTPPSAPAALAAPSPGRGGATAAAVDPAAAALQAWADLTATG
jgi:membrane peptidoglycan carboxypeptidase